MRLIFPQAHGGCNGHIEFWYKDYIENCKDEPFGKKAVCEDCGKPFKRHSNGWLYTLMVVSQHWDEQYMPPFDFKYKFYHPECYFNSSEKCMDYTSKYLKQIDIATKGKILHVSEL
jgi:hypothetical protein